MATPGVFGRWGEIVPEDTVAYLHKSERLSTGTSAPSRPRCHIPGYFRRRRRVADWNYVLRIRFHVLADHIEKVEKAAGINRWIEVYAAKCFTRYLNNVKLPGEERRRREYQRQMFALWKAKVMLLGVCESLQSRGAIPRTPPPKGLVGPVIFIV